MNARKGYYSVIQYCPDPSRAEAANVGVVLFCPEPHSIGARISDHLAKARRFFSLDAGELARVRSHARSVAAYFSARSDDFRNIDDLTNYAALRAGDIRITPPLVVRVEDSDAELSRLFGLMVESVDVRRRPAALLPDAVADVFRRLSIERRIFQPPRIIVPVTGRRLPVDYAYLNGVANLVKPVRFEQNPDDKAMRLAVQGDQVFRHGESIEGLRPRLVVLSAAEQGEADARLAGLFGDYNVRYVPRSEADAFAHEVEETAH